MAVQARFYVAESTRFAHGSKRPGWADPAPMGRVVLQPVVRGEGNKSWASATPSGRIEMTVNGPALPWFEERLGSEVAITFDDIPTEVTALRCEECGLTTPHSDGDHHWPEDDETPPLGSVVC